MSTPIQSQPTEPEPKDEIIVHEDESEETEERSRATSSVRDMAARIPEQLSAIGRDISRTIERAISAKDDYMLAVKVSQDAQIKLGQLVQAGVFGTRAEAAAFLVDEGIKLQTELFERVEAKLGEIERLRAELRGIDYQMPMASAQVKSAVLLAGLFAEGVTGVTEPAPTRDHTELALEEFGASIEKSGQTIRVRGLGAGNGSGQLLAKSLDVPGDLSSAVFFLAAASLFPDSNVLIHNVGLNPTRTVILDVFAEMGAAIQMLGLKSSQGEIVGDLAVKGASLKGGVIAGERIPLVIDELPMLAALGPYTEEGIEIRDAAELRVKESDRIAALAENLRRMDAKVEERPDGLQVAGRVAGKLRGAEIDPRGDHRIAMAFAVAGLAAEGNTVIRDANCAGVSFPAFFSELNRLAER